MKMASFDIESGLHILSELRGTQVVDRTELEEVRRLTSATALAKDALIKRRFDAVRVYDSGVDKAFESFGGSFSVPCPVSPVSYDSKSGVLSVLVVPPGQVAPQKIEFYGVKLSWSEKSGSRVASTSWSPSGLAEGQSPGVFSEARQTFVKLRTTVDGDSGFVSKVVWFFWMDDRWSEAGMSLEWAVSEFTSGFLSGTRASDIGMFFVFVVHLYLRGLVDVETGGVGDSSIVLEDDWHAQRDGSFDSSRLFLEGGMLGRYRHGFYTRYGFVAPYSSHRDVLKEPSGTRLLSSKGRAVSVDANFCVSDIIPFFASHGVSSALINSFVDLTV